MGTAMAMGMGVPEPMALAREMDAVRDFVEKRQQGHRGTAKTLQEDVVKQQGCIAYPNPWPRSGKRKYSGTVLREDNRPQGHSQNSTVLCQTE